MVNITTLDWNSKLRLSIDRLHSSMIPSLVDNQMRDILLAIGLLTIGLLCFLLVIQFVLKVRQIYRTSEPKPYRTIQQCQCFGYSCLPRSSCVTSIDQIFHRYPYYEQIDETQLSIHVHHV